MPLDHLNVPLIKAIAYKNGAKINATMDMSFINMLSDGPGVSSKGLQELRYA